LSARRGADIWSLSHALMGGIARRVMGHFVDLRSSLLKSRMKVALEAYVSFILFVTVVAAAASFASSFAVLWLVLRLPCSLALLLSCAVAMLCSALAFAATYVYPSFRAVSFAARIEDDLPYAVIHMAVMSAAGATPEEMIRSVAAVPRDAVAEFMSDVVRDIDLLGMDLVTALERARDRSPSRTLSEFLSEIIGIVRTGGNIRDFLVSYSRSLLGTRAAKAREFSETLSTLAEVFVILMVVFPLLLIVMFSIMALVGGQIGGLGISAIMFLITYVIVPGLGIAFLVILDQIMPKGE